MSTHAHERLPREVVVFERACALARATLMRAVLYGTTAYVAVFLVALATWGPPPAGPEWFRVGAWFVRASWVGPMCVWMLGLLAVSARLWVGLYGAAAGLAMVIVVTSVPLLV